MTRYPVSATSDQLCEVVELLIDGLITDGGHHKQWYMEEVLKVLGVDLDLLRDELLLDDYDWESGIAP